jgi:hypothetical protein
VVTEEEAGVVEEDMVVVVVVEEDAGDTDKDKGIRVGLSTNKILNKLKS